MPAKKLIEPGKKLPLKLTATERKLILDESFVVAMDYEDTLRDTPAGEPVMMTLDELDDFGGYIAAEANHCGDKRRQKKLDAVFEKVEHLLETHTDEPPVKTIKLKAARKPKPSPRANATASSDTGLVYQFKITLLDCQPKIWRRIQVEDGTLDKLHEHIQTAMGWTNSHLHQFEINGERYGDPELMDDGFDEFDGADSTQTLLSDILPQHGKRFTFVYEYDFGDGWVHEVLFEGRSAREQGRKYPVCSEGSRCCPPEDCGGPGGNQDLLAILANPKHERLREWCGGSFSSDDFDPAKATQAMKRGLPNWRTM